ncbi:hypothetical protein Tco_0158688 [Tanacetum coccineum]
MLFAGGTVGAVFNIGPLRVGVLNDLSAEDKERYKDDIRCNQISLTSGGIPRTLLLTQSITYDAKTLGKRGRWIWRFGQPNNDPLALVSDASVQQYPTQSSKFPQPTKEPSPADNFQLDSGSFSTETCLYGQATSRFRLLQGKDDYLYSPGDGKAEYWMKNSCLFIEVGEKVTTLIMMWMIYTVENDLALQ